MKKLIQLHHLERGHSVDPHKMYPIYIVFYRDYFASATAIKLII